MLTSVVLEQPDPTETAPDQSPWKFFTQLRLNISPQDNMLVLLKPPAESLWRETFNR